MCLSNASWKREVVQDHKFDFIDTRDYHSKSFGIRVRYIWVYVLVVKSFLVYMSDIFTAVTMLSSQGWTNQIYTQCLAKQSCTIDLDFNIARWVFVGCIIFSFLLLAYEGHKAKKIIASRDISYAFTNVMANMYYSLRSYDHFCFFCQIENSTKKKDDFAFFIFFTFKGWKRLLLADGPRQCINGLILYSFWEANNESFDPMDYLKSEDPLTSVLFITQLFTVTVFAGSVLLLLIAAVCYVPLLCYIQGNLKEYCCHKVDKRIAELIKRKNKLRLRKQAQLARKEAAGDFSHLKDKDGNIVGAVPQPTLPDIDIDDEPTPGPPMHRGMQPPYAADPYYGQEPKGADGYSSYSSFPGSQQPPFYPSQNGRPDSYYDGASDYGSTAHLAPTHGQAPPVPMGDPRVQGPGQAMGGGYYGNDPRYAYPEHAQYGQEPQYYPDQYVQNQAPQYQPGDRRSHGSTLAYSNNYSNQPQGGLPSYEHRDGKQDGHGGGYAM